MKRRAFLYGAGAAAVAAWQTWPTRSGTAAPVTTDEIRDQVQTLPTAQLPEFATTGKIQRLYRYAVENGDELQYIPFFCGRYRFCHNGNRHCYSEGVNADGPL